VCGAHSPINKNKNQSRIIVGFLKETQPHGGPLVDDTLQHRNTSLRVALILISVVRPITTYTQIFCYCSHSYTKSSSPFYWTGWILFDGMLVKGPICLGISVHDWSDGVRNEQHKAEAIIMCINVACWKETSQAVFCVGICLLLGGWNSCNEFNRRFGVRHRVSNHAGTGTRLPLVDFFHTFPACEQIMTKGFILRPLIVSRQLQ